MTLRDFYEKTERWQAFKEKQKSESTPLKIQVFAMFAKTCNDMASQDFRIFNELAGAC